jgi:hypothetical protein
MAERVRDVSDHDLALYRAIVGHKPAATPSAHRLSGWRRCVAFFGTPGSRMNCLVRLARQRLREGLRRFGLTTRF